MCLCNDDYYEENVSKLVISIWMSNHSVARINLITCFVFSNFRASSIIKLRASFCNCRSISDVE